MTVATKISVYQDVKSSQSRSHVVSLYEPGVGVEIHRFETRDEADMFADKQNGNR